MKAKIYLSVLAACIIATSACKKIDPLEGTSKTVSPHAASSDTDVYAAGYLFSQPQDLDPAAFNPRTPAYWKNGVLYKLPMTSDLRGYADGIALVNGDVLVSGTEADSATFTTWAVYWRNGIETVLAANATANGMFVDSIGNFYIAGSIGNMACYWKNGVIHQLPCDPGDGGGDQMRGDAILVKGNDVYVVGLVNIPSKIAQYAGYWKNDQLQILQPDFDAEAYGIAFNGSDVYIVGNNASQAAVWKNGVPSFPTDASSAAGIAFAGNDQYIVGSSITNGGVYWKNGVEVPLNNSSYGAAPAMCINILGNNVYIGGGVIPSGGQNVHVPAYWKNGALVQLPYQGNGGVLAIAAALRH